MNVLFIDQFGQLGGGQLCLLDLIPGVLSKGWKPFAAVPGDGPLASRLTDLNVSVEVISPGQYASGTKTAADAFRYLKAIPALSNQLSDCIRRNAIDLLYVNGPRLLPAACLASKGVPMVFHAHSYLPGGVARQIARGSLRAYGTPVIAVSEFVAGYLRGAVSPSRLTIVHNGVADASRIRKAHNGPPRIGIIGRIAPEKGHLDLIEAARLLPRDWQFRVYGTALLADPAYERQVRTRAAGLPVEFLGWSDDVGQALSELDLLIVPSNGHEASGRVILEAFSAGTPVVAYRSGGIPELIEHETTGYLVDQRRPDLLAAQIRKSIGNPLQRRAIAKSARVLWEKRFTLEHYREGVTQVMARAAQRVKTPATISTGE